MCNFVPVECENATSHSRESETVTKHLAFIDPENDAHVDHVFKTYVINVNEYNLWRKSD